MAEASADADAAADLENLAAVKTFSASYCCYAYAAAKAKTDVDAILTSVN
jgi:hypothetical protein